MECQLADSLSGYELNVVIENLSFNTPDNEHSPLVSADGNTLIFTSNRNSTKKGEHEDIFITTRTAKGWSEPKLLSKNLTTEYNDAATSLSPDGTTLFIYSEEGAGDIHTSVWNGTDWSTPQPLNKNINTSQYWETSASLSADGRQLFFASNRPDGYGELDLYVSELDSKGQWGKAVNLGDLVNTPGNDDSPSIHYDGKTLYFSSDGHPRLGNSDIFVSELKGTKWQKPENMGYPINLWEYDGFFTMAPDKKTGYYATVKEGGKGMVDIYSIRFLEPKFKPKPKPVEIVATVKPESRKKEDYYDPMVQQFKDNRVVTVLRGKVIDETTAQPLAASITLVDNESKRVIARIETEEETGDFELVIPHGGNYGVTTQRSGYLFNSINFNVPKFAEYQEIDTHVIMVKAEVGSKAVLRNIFFDIGKSDLKNHSIAEIEQIVQLLEANPHMSVQINGHTDNQGNPTLNKELSLKRANAVVSYLVTKGIDAQRLSAKGYGAERPIVSNDDEAGGREINRRTEIEIIGGN
jgi:outer membrane protein OmpA-like peptidoglycan-associated protein